MSISLNVVSIAVVCCARTIRSAMLRRLLLIGTRRDPAVLADDVGATRGVFGDRGRVSRFGFSPGVGSSAGADFALGGLGEVGCFAGGSERGADSLCWDGTASVLAGRGDSLAASCAAISSIRAMT